MFSVINVSLVENESCTHTATALLAHTAITNGATTVITGSTSRIVGISPGIADAGTVASILFSGATEFQNATDAPTIAQADLQNAMTYMHTLIPTVVSANLSLAADATMFPGIYTTPDGVFSHD